VVLLVVVEDALDGDDSRVVVAREVGAGVVLLVPVEDTTDEGGNEGDASLGASDGLAETEEEGQVAVDAVVALELAGGLDTFPGGGDLDENAVLGDTDGLVELDELLSLGFGSLLVERELGVDLGGDTSRDNGEDLLAELDEETVKSVLGLSLDITALLLGVLHGYVNEGSVGGLLGGGEDEGGVGGGVLRLVSGNGLEVTRVGNDNGTGGLKLVKRSRHV